MRCLWLSMAAAAIVGFIAIAQSLGVAGVPALVAKLTSSSSGSDGMETVARGSSLLGLPAATADLAILNLGIAVAMIARGHPRRLLAGRLRRSLRAHRRCRVGVRDGDRLGRGRHRAHGAHQIGPARRLHDPGRTPRRGAALASDRAPAQRLPFHRRPAAQLGRPALQPADVLLARAVLRSQLDPGGAALAPHRRTKPKRAASSGSRAAIPGCSGAAGSRCSPATSRSLDAVLRKSWAYARRADAAGIAATAVAAAMCSQVVLMVF